MVTAAEVPGWRILGQLSDASNATLLVEIDGVRHVYKPVAGERPLWDFPDGTLALREVAACAVAQALDWPIVPPTRWVDQAPFGPGSVQEWVSAEGIGVGIYASGSVPDGWLPVLRGEDEHGDQVEVAHRDSPQMLQLAVFDLIVNNADRKGGHIYERVDGTVRGVDHGLCFHQEPKLRTVLWGFAGRPVPAALLTDLDRIRPQVPDCLTGLDGDEVAGTAHRIQEILDRPVMPAPHAGAPAIPWPPL